MLQRKIVVEKQQFSEGENRCESPPYQFMKVNNALFVIGNQKVNKNHSWKLYVFFMH